MITVRETYLLLLGHNCSALLKLEHIILIFVQVLRVNVCCKIGLRQVSYSHTNSSLYTLNPQFIKKQNDGFVIRAITKKKKYYAMFPPCRKPFLIITHNII